VLGGMCTIKGRCNDVPGLNGVNEMTKVTIDLPEGYEFQTKINGQAIQYHVDKMDQSWIIAFLEKGMQRFANDKYSGETGQTKFDLCRGIAKAANSGEEMPVTVRGSSKPKMPDNMALAVKNAKADLTLLFKRVTGQGKIVDMVAHEKVAPFFIAKGDAMVWRDEVVQSWIGKQKDAGKDYVAEADAALAVDVSALDF